MVGHAKRPMAAIVGHRCSDFNFGIYYFLIPNLILLIFKMWRRHACVWSFGVFKACQIIISVLLPGICCKALDVIFCGVWLHARNGNFWFCLSNLRFLKVGMFWRFRVFIPSRFHCNSTIVWPERLFKMELFYLFLNGKDHQKKRLRPSSVQAS